MPAQHRLRLDDEQGLFPTLHLARKQDEERPICAGAARSLDRAVEHDELLTKEHVFRNQLRFTARKISNGPQSRRVGDWLGQARQGRADRAKAMLNYGVKTIEDAAHDHHLLLHDPTAAAGPSAVAMPDCSSAGPYHAERQTPRRWPHEMC